jgi:hypothetical protein
MPITPTMSPMSQSLKAAWLDAPEAASDTLICISPDASRSTASVSSLAASLRSRRPAMVAATWRVSSSWTAAPACSSCSRRMKWLREKSLGYAGPAARNLRSLARRSALLSAGSSISRFTR